MTDRPKEPSSGDKQVGYGRPPSRTRFRKGMSGNPGGRPRGMTAGRAKALALKEAYRPISVREGDKLLAMPAIQVVLRNLVAGAAKGNGPSQRALIELVQTKDKAKAEERPMSDLEVARRIAFLLNKAARQSQPSQPVPRRLTRTDEEVPEHVHALVPGDDEKSR
jgi:hypothetical protein